MADSGAKGPAADADLCAQGATVNGLRFKLWKATRIVSAQWWANQRKSRAYDGWRLDYTPTKEPKELGLPRQLLGHYVAMRTGYGDFRNYYVRFNH